MDDDWRVPLWLRNHHMKPLVTKQDVRVSSFDGSPSVELNQQISPKKWLQGSKVPTCISCTWHRSFSQLWARRSLLLPSSSNLGTWAFGFFFGSNASTWIEMTQNPNIPRYSIWFLWIYGRFSFSHWILRSAADSTAGPTSIAKDLGTLRSQPAWLVCFVAKAPKNWCLDQQEENLAFPK